MTEAWAPLCMDAADWSFWQKTNPVHLGGDRVAHRPCNDCPLGFAAEMRAAGKCNGTPGGVEIEEEPMEPVRLAMTGKEIPVAMSLPCERCAHAPVCSIKAVLEARVETLPVPLPRLDPAVHVVLSATVECDHFLRAKGAPVQPASARGRYQRTPEHSAKIAASNRARAAERRAGDSAAS